jgi:hypothetical protein
MRGKYPLIKDLWTVIKDNPNILISPFTFDCKTALNYNSKDHLWPISEEMLKSSDKSET